MKITVGTNPISIGALGRYFLSGNHGNHTLKIVDADTGSDVPGGSTTVNMALGTAGTFVYAPLANNITLTPNHSYYVVAIEGQFGDAWYDLNTQVQTSSVAAVNGAGAGTASCRKADAQWRIYRARPLARYLDCRHCPRLEGVSSK